MSADHRLEINEIPPDPAADQALRDALFALDVPTISPGFDARVLEAVRGRSVWREMFLCYLRPALATATVSAVVTLLLVNFSTRPPRPVLAESRPLSVRDEQVGADQVRRALESGAPTYAALQALRETLREPPGDSPRDTSRPSVPSPEAMD